MTDRIVAFLILCLMFSLPLSVAVIFTGEVMLNFIFLWPLFMSALWMSGGLYFWFYRERHWKWGKDTPPPVLEGSPLISILIPCYNEGDNARETIEAALAQRYENIEVIAINDGSKDNTGEVLNQLASEYPRLRVIHLAENQGKAVALKTGAGAARSDFLVCIDGDALLDRDAAAYMVAPLLQFPRVGAVTGNPRVRTRSTLIGRVQVGEFSSIIGLIKRTQRVYGQVFTVSGVIAAFRRRALAEVGYWSPDMITEDIDISWKLQLRHWSVFFEPRAVLDPDAGDIERALEAASSLGAGWRRGVYRQYAPPVGLGISPDVAAVCRVLSVDRLGFFLRDQHSAVPAGAASADAGEPVRSPSVPTGLYRIDVGRGVPSAVPGQPADRTAL